MSIKQNIRTKASNTGRAAKRYATIACITLNVLAIAAVFGLVSGHALGYVKFDTSPVPRVMTARQQVATLTGVGVPDESLSDLAANAIKPAPKARAKPVKQVSTDGIRLPERSPLAQAR